MTPKKSARPVRYAWHLNPVPVLAVAGVVLTAIGGGSVAFARFVGQTAEDVASVAAYAEQTATFASWWPAWVISGCLLLVLAVVCLAYPPQAWGLGGSSKPARSAGRRIARRWRSFARDSWVPHTYDGASWLPGLLWITPEADSLLLRLRLPKGCPPNGVDEWIKAGRSNLRIRAEVSSVEVAEIGGHTAILRVVPRDATETTREVVPQ